MAFVEGCRGGGDCLRGPSPTDQYLAESLGRLVYAITQTDDLRFQYHARAAEQAVEATQGWATR